MTTSVVSTETSVIEQQLASAREAVALRAGVARVALTACGGSYAVMLPGEYFLAKRASTLESQALNAAEFTSRNSGRIDAETIVILCSHSGTTPETVAAAKYARQRGALTIAFTHELDSPLALAAEFVIGYLASPLAGSTTGSALDVDGGATHVRVRPLEN